MPLLSDPVVAAKLCEFRATVDALVRATFMTDGDRASVVRELCELSRSAKFDLGPVRFAETAQVEEVASCFEESVEAIRSMWQHGVVPSEVDKFCSNIERRARRCRGED